MNIANLFIRTIIRFIYKKQGRREGAYGETVGFPYKIEFKN